MVTKSLCDRDGCVQIVTPAVRKDALHGCRHKGIVFAEASVVGRIATGRGVCEAADSAIYIERVVQVLVTDVLSRQHTRGILLTGEDSESTGNTSGKNDEHGRETRH